MTVERADTQVFDAILSEAEPIRKDVNVIRGMTRAIDEQHFVRVRKVTPLASIQLSDGKITESESSNLLIDITKPIEDSRAKYLRIGSAVWAASTPDTVTLAQEAYLAHLEPDDLPEGYTPDDVFRLYDELKRDKGGRGNTMPGWFNPDIYTAKGLQELALLLRNSGEA
jgi:hypothetical protein